jgi:NTP pyrophosphatase (non-canonical NTP hydrolase)
LSVTLRDAQHLCWKNFRTINDKLDPERGKKWTPAVTVSEILEESSMIRAAVEDMEVLKTEEKPKTNEKLAKELSNLLYLTLVLAEHYKIELEESFLQTVNDLIISRL